MTKKTAAKTAKKKPIKVSNIRSCNPVDTYVGARVKSRRNILGISQEALAESLGLTFQQVQKYERGDNRISASRLHQLSKILGVDVNFFFDGFDESNPSTAYADSDLNASEFDWLEKDDGDLLTRKESTTLLRTYYTVKDPEVRKNFQKMLKSLVGIQTLNPAVTRKLKP